MEGGLAVWAIEGERENAAGGWLALVVFLLHSHKSLFHLSIFLEEISILLFDLCIFPREIGESGRDIHKSESDLTRVTHWNLNLRREVLPRVARRFICRAWGQHERKDLANPGR